MKHKNTSLAKQPRRTPEEKFVLLFEAAKRSLLAAHAILKRLGDELVSLEPDIRAKTNVGERIVPALLSCVTFVDFAHRYGELVAQLPKLNKSAPEMRQLQSALKPVEAARHHLQHLRRDLSINDEIDYPILGSISWASGDTCFLAYLTQPTSSFAAAMGYDTQERRWVAAFQYRVNNDFINLDTVLAAMQSNYDWIVSAVQFPNPTDANLTWGETHCFSYIVSLSSAADPLAVPLPLSERYIRVGARIEGRNRAPGGV